MEMTDEYKKKQVATAKWIFGVLLFLLLGFVFGVMIFQFGWFGVAAANGVFVPAPTATVTPAPASVAGAEAGGTPGPTPAPSETPATPQTSPVTPATVGSTYLTWLFASWAGVTIYLLGMCARRFYSIGRDPDTDFVKYTPWYIINFVRAPLLAMIVLWILTNIDISLGAEGGAQGVVASFKDLPAIVLLAIAFILGMYARVSQKQIDIIAKAIFPKAWVMAEESFMVKGPEILLLKDQSPFQVDPAADVVWTATLGSIDPETGIYKAPEDLSADDKKAIIQASLRSDPSKTNYKAVTLKLMKISGPVEAYQGEPLALSINTKSDKLTDDVLDTVEWSSSEITLTTKQGKKTAFTVDDPAVKTVKVKAKLILEENTYTAETSITIKTALS